MSNVWITSHFLVILYIRMISSSSVIISLLTAAPNRLGLSQISQLCTSIGATTLLADNFPGHTQPPPLVLQTFLFVMFVENTLYHHGGEVRSDCIAGSFATEALNNECSAANRHNKINVNSCLRGCVCELVWGTGNCGFISHAWANVCPYRIPDFLRPPLP